MPARSNVNRREGTRTLTCDRGLMPRTPLNVSLHRFEPYARYSTVLFFSFAAEISDAVIAVASKGASFKEAARRSCEVFGTGAKTRFGRLSRRRSEVDRPTSFQQQLTELSGSAAVDSPAWDACGVCVVEVIAPKDCVLLTGQLLLVRSCITPDLLVGRTYYSGMAI